MVNFPENYNQLKLTQEEMSDLNPMTMKDLKSTQVIIKI